MRMMDRLRQWWNGSRPSTTPRPSATSLQVEGLEERQVPSIAFDTTFGAGQGYTFHSVEPFVGANEGRSNGIAELAFGADGKSVVAHSPLDASKVYVLRINSDGSLDRTFDGDGVASVDFPSPRVRAAAVQPDGKVLVGGSSGGSFFLMRFTSDGRLDATFDGDGIVKTDLKTEQHWVDGDLALQ